jgi:hypothetical protein
MTDRIHFASIEAKTPAQRRRETAAAAEAVGYRTPEFIARERAQEMPGWEQEFWKLLSPDTAARLRDELARK